MVAAGTQKAMKLADEFGALASQAPGTIENVRLPAPSRAVAAVVYLEKATAAPEGLYEGAKQLEEVSTQALAAHWVQEPPPKEFATLPAADQMAI